MWHDAGRLSASHDETTGLQCTARLYHQAMDKCQRLQSENIALRQMLQQALEHGPKARPRSSSRGRNQLCRGGECAEAVVKPGLSFVAERSRSASCGPARSCSPPLSRSVCLTVLSCLGSGFPVCIHVCLSVCLCMHISPCLPVCLSVCLPACLAVSCLAACGKLVLISSKWQLCLICWHSCAAPLFAHCL